MRFLLALLVALALPASAHARWLEARSANFTVYSDGGEDELRQTVTLLEDYDHLLRTVTGTKAASGVSALLSPLKLYLVSSRAKLDQVRNLLPGVVGFYQMRVGGTAAFAVRGDQPGLGGEQIVLHEYAHHFMSRYYPAHYPTWYQEGFAEYVMTARFTADRIELGRYNPNRAVTLMRGTWLPLDRLLSGVVSPAERGQFYAESWLLVHYIFADPARSEQLTRYLAGLNRGTAEPEAFRAAFGMDHAAFEKRLRRYMIGGIGYGSMPRPAASAADVRVAPLPASADELLLRNAALTLGIADPAHEKATLFAVRQEAARFLGDAYAERVLARAEINAGDRPAGAAIAERLLRDASDDAELLYIRGTADFFAGRKDEAARSAHFAAARPWFTRAVAADAGSYTMAYRLAQTDPAGLARAGDDTLDLLLKAHALAPQVGDIAVDAATALMARGRNADAVRVLLPIATNPHGGHSEEARNLLAKARGE